MSSVAQGPELWDRGGLAFGPLDRRFTGPPMPRVSQLGHRGFGGLAGWRSQQVPPAPFQLSGSPPPAPGPPPRAASGLPAAGGRAWPPDPQPQRKELPVGPRRAAGRKES